MKEITAIGQNVEEAVDSALKQLKATRDRIDIQIIDEGKKGFLGLFGTKPAIVKAILKPDPLEEAKNYLLEIIRAMGIEAHIDIESSGRTTIFKISGEKIALLIGKRGQTLNSLQTLTQLKANKYKNYYTNIILDAEDYRNRREQSLIQLAQRLAEKAIQTKKDVVLEPMPSFERKIMHSALAKNSKIKTYSEGEEPNRYLVINPIKKL